MPFIFYPDNPNQTPQQNPNQYPAQQYPQYPQQFPMPVNPGMGNVYPIGPGYPGMPMNGKDPVEIPVKLVPSFGAQSPMFPPMMPPFPPEPKPAPKSGGIGFMDVAIILLILFVFFVFFAAAAGVDMGGM